MMRNNMYTKRQENNSFVSSPVPREQSRASHRIFLTLLNYHGTYTYMLDRKEEGILSEVKAKSLTSKPAPGCIGFLLLPLGVHVFHTELNHQNYWKRPVQLYI